MNPITPPSSPRAPSYSNSAEESSSEESDPRHEVMEDIIHNTFTRDITRPQELSSLSSQEHVNGIRAFRSQVLDEETGFTGVRYFFNDHKYGEIIVKNKTIYRGFFENDLAHGYGTYHYANGMVGEGSFVNGFLHGKGSLFCPQDRSLYIGEFHHGKSIGLGRLSYSNGTFYEGDFNHNVQFRTPIPHGQGRLTYKGGETHEACFVDGIPEVLLI